MKSFINTNIEILKTSTHNTPHPLNFDLKNANDIN